MKPDNVRSVLAIAGQVLLVFGAFAGGIWAAALWTSGQENKFTRIEYRLEQVEKVLNGAAPQESRIGRIEYRLDQIDKTSVEDRVARRQFETDIKAALNDINGTLTQVQISLGAKFPRR